MAVCYYRFVEPRASESAESSSVEALQSELVVARKRIADLESERDRLKASFEQLWLEVELLKKRITVAKAERVDTTQLELEFSRKLRELEEAAGTAGVGTKDDGENPGKPRSSRKPTGRRDVSEMDLPVERIEQTDPESEAAVAAGTLVRHGVEETWKLGYQQGGLRRVVIVRTKYRSREEISESGALAVTTTPMPPELFARSIATASLIAYVIHEKYCRGLPFFRVESTFAALGVSIARSMMCRWAEEFGATLGATVVQAARAHALATAFCISTDATGIAVQPIRTDEKGKPRQACRRGHLLVQLADRDHVFFEYMARETSEAISESFRGFSGYVQADAKSVFDALYRPASDEESPDRLEVGCFAHARRKFWEATVTKSELAREGLMRIGRIFAIDATWKNKPPSEIKRLRDSHLRPHLESFFQWAEDELEKVKDQRGLVRSAFIYATNQKAALMRVLDDGRLRLDNNRSEAQLRHVAVGRKAWLFVGSDDHGESTGHLFSVIASARMHGIEPQRYLRDLIRVLPHWPKDRYLELAPLFWKRTRPRLNTVELDAEIGPLTIPDPIDLSMPAAEQQPASD